jgi:hypothetical protein
VPVVVSAHAPGLVLDLALRSLDQQEHQVSALRADEHGDRRGGAHRTLLAAAR